VVPAVEASLETRWTIHGTIWYGLASRLDFDNLLSIIIGSYR
jgi:hypothetical protein